MAHIINTGMIESAALEQMGLYVAAITLILGPLGHHSRLECILEVMMGFCMAQIISLNRIIMSRTVRKVGLNGIFLSSNDQS